MLHLQKELIIPPSYTDARAYLTVLSAATIMQDIAGEHAELMGVGFHDLEVKSNAFFVITRTKVKMLAPAKMYQKILVETWPSKPSGLVCIRNYRISSMDGEVIALGKNEWVIIDAETHKLRRLNSTCYPMEEEYFDEFSTDEPFIKVYAPWDKEDYAYSHRVRYSDTDHVHHTNNLSYIRILMDALPSDFFETHEITDFEIKYAHESKEGDDIAVYSKQAEDGYFLYGRTISGQEIVTAKLTAKKR